MNPFGKSSLKIITILSIFLSSIINLSCQEIKYGDIISIENPNGYLYSKGTSTVESKEDLDEAYGYFQITSPNGKSGSVTSGDTIELKNSDGLFIGPHLSKLIKGNKYRTKKSKGKRLLRIEKADGELISDGDNIALYNINKKRYFKTKEKDKKGKIYASEESAVYEFTIYKKEVPEKEIENAIYYGDKVGLKKEEEFLCSEEENIVVLKQDCNKKNRSFTILDPKNLNNTSVIENNMEILLKNSDNKYIGTTFRLGTKAKYITGHETYRKGHRRFKIKKTSGEGTIKQEDEIALLEQGKKRYIIVASENKELAAVGKKEDEEIGAPETMTIVSLKEIAEEEIEEEEIEEIEEKVITEKVEQEAKAIEKAAKEDVTYLKEEAIKTFMPDIDETLTIDETMITKEEEISTIIRKPAPDLKDEIMYAEEE